MNGKSVLIELANRSLSFDLQLIPDQMDHVSDILNDTPDLKVALCHCGSPWYRDKHGWALWRRGLEKLAKRDNTVCKISGLSMFDHKWSVATIRLQS